MSRALATPWIKPISVDPQHFVNRKDDVRRLTRMLTDLVNYDARQGLVLVGGDRGIGKSIFCRAVMASVAAQHPERVLTLVLNGRMANMETLLRRFAQGLCEQARAMAQRRSWDADWVATWLDPLAEIGLNERITRGINATTGREYGAISEVAAGLWGVLSAKFGAQWKERREQGQRTELTLTVHPEVLRVAITAALEELAKKVTVIVFFDDLDQAAGMDSAEGAKQILQVMVDLVPAITIVHLRSEVKFPDIRREHTDHIDLGPLDPDPLKQIMRKRLDLALESDQALVNRRDGWAPIDRLITATGNPLVLLRWVAALANRSDVWPPPADWTTPDALRRLAIDAAAAPSGVDEDVAVLGQVLDRLNKSSGLTEPELEAGRRALDAEPVQARLDRAQIARLERHELLMQVDRFDRTLGLRLDPLLDLCRPSVAARVGARA